MTTSKYNLPLITSGQAQKEVSYNTAVHVLDALLFPRVTDRDLSTPPVSPANGALYLVATGASGAWSSHDGKLALWQDGWYFTAPLNGMLVFVIDENIWLHYVNSNWQSPQHNASFRRAIESTTRPAQQYGGDHRSLYIGDGSATFTNSTVYLGFNAARTAANTWSYQTDGTRNGGAILEGRMDGALRVFVRASGGGSPATESDATTAANERLQVQRNQVSLGGALGSESARVVTVSNMVNRVELVGAATGAPIILRAGGTDTNIDVQVTPKGTGVLNLSLDPTNLVTTVGATGAASSLPANPLGYLRVRLNGTVRKIPYYND